MNKDFSVYIPWCLRESVSRDRLGLRFLRKKRGSVLFLDISGFTGMTEKLMLTGREGSEELTFLINKYFDCVIDIIYYYGGDIIKFGGDALLCYFWGLDSYRLALQSVERIMRLMKREYVRVNTSAGKFALNVHCGISEGEFWECSVGEEGEQLEYLIFGDAVRQAITLAESVAANEVGVGRSLSNKVNDLFKYEVIERGEVIKLRELNVCKEVSRRVDIGDRDEYLLFDGEQFIPKYIREHIERADYIGEHRRVIVCFLELRGAYGLLMSIKNKKRGSEIDSYFIEVMSRVYTDIGRVLENYEGTYLKTDISANGEKIIYLFGAPVSHEDDMERALEATNEIIESLKGVNEVYKAELLALDDIFTVRCGLAAGDAFWAIVGSKLRKELTVMGDSVNLAARLMNLSPAWSISVVEQFTKKSPNYEWIYIGDYLIKGKRDKFKVYKFGKKIMSSQLSLQGEELIIGREKELDELDKCIDATYKGNKYLISICADAGMGKTLLCDNFIKRCRLKGVSLLKLTCHAFVSEEPYYIWKQLIKQIFELNDINVSDAKSIESFLSKHIGAHKKWIPVINAILDIAINENEWTNSLDSKGRKAKLYELIYRFMSKLSELNPLFIVIDDAHWMDNASLELIKHLYSIPSQEKVMTVLSHRKELRIDELKSLTSTKAIDLEKFGREESYRLMDHILGIDKRFKEIKKTIIEKADGNPLFIKLLSENVITQAEISYKEVILPDSISSMFLSIIDRFPNEEKSFIKLASIIGKTFNINDMKEIFSAELKEFELDLTAERLCQNQWIIKEYDSQYSFRYPLMQEVAYDSIPYSYKRLFHSKIAAYYENKAKDSSKILEFLTYHYYRSSNADKAIEHLINAAHKSNSLYLLNQSSKYFSDAVDMIEKLKQKRYSAYFFHVFPAKNKMRQYEFNALSGWAKVLSQMGRMKIAIAKFSKAIKKGIYLRQTHELVKLKNKLAHCYFVIGQFKKASELVHSSLDESKNLKYPEAIASSYNILINLCYVRKDYKNAIHFSKLAVKYASKSFSLILLADIYSNLGIIYWSMNRINKAIYYAKKALAIRRKNKDKYGIATSYNNIGVCYFHKKSFKQALYYYRKSVKIHTALDDLYGVAWNYNNIGEIFFELGKLKLALKYFSKANTIAKEYGDKALQTITALFIASVFFRGGQYKEGLAYFNEAEEEALKLNIYEELMIAYYWIVCYLINVEDDKLVIAYGKKLKGVMSKIDKTKFYYCLYSNRIKLLKKIDI